MSSVENTRAHYVLQSSSNNNNNNNNNNNSHHYYYYCRKHVLHVLCQPNLMLRAAAVAHLAEFRGM